MIAFAVFSGGQRPATVLRESEYPAVLVSFAADPRGDLIDQLGYTPDEVMLDSGAFTAWTTGKQVDVGQLVAWCRDYRQRYPSALVFNLDVIPGGPTTRPTAREVTDAIERSTANAELLRSEGLGVMEVFHLYDPLPVLEAIIERRRPGERIALGGLARWTGGPGATVKRRFCDAAFSLLLDADRQVVPVHGLGVSPDSVEIGAWRYPWVSCDSTSWTGMGRFGVKVLKNGKRLSGRTDTRAGHRDVNALYSRRVLDRWSAPVVTTMWRERGVTFHD